MTVMQGINIHPKILMIERMKVKEPAITLNTKMVQTNTEKKDNHGANRYSTKIIKAGALLSDTKVLLSAWEPGLPFGENMYRIQNHNLLGKSSRSRVKDILAIFRQRYLSEDAVTRALVSLVQSQSNGHTLDQILYYHAACSDALLRDVVIKCLLPQWSSGDVDIHPRDIEEVLKRWIKEGKTTGTWGEYTIYRVTRGLLATLRDFGILKGAVNKRIAPVYLSTPAFSYIAFYLSINQRSGAKLLEHDDWKLFFLTREGVERYFLEAHQHNFLEFQMAGSVIRITFPVTTLMEYIHVITRREYKTP